MRGNAIITLLALLPLVAGAQAPAPAATVPATIEQEKSGAAAGRQATQRSAPSRPGAAPPPMNIRIRDEGIKMPLCTAESREGEACRK